MHQNRLTFAYDVFEPPPSIPEPRVPEAAERKRLNTQAEKMLAQLRQGDMTNLEMLAISAKYTSRASEVRAYLRQHEAKDLVCLKRLRPGVTLYGIRPLEHSL